MKPEWKDAPEWANWLAMEIDDAWYWYENEPTLYRIGWINEDEGRWRFASESSDAQWKKSLEKRPDAKE